MNKKEVDDYFNKKSNLSSPETIDRNILRSEIVQIEEYNKLRLSRLNYGIKDFTLNLPYIQTSDDAEEILGWIIKKSMTPKLLVGANIFATPILQLGDIVNIDYNKNNIDIVSDISKKFVIYHIDYERSSVGPNMTLYMSEV